MQAEDRSPSNSSVRDSSSFEQKKQSMSSLQSLFKQREQDYLDKLTLLADEKATLEGRLREMTRARESDTTALHKATGQIESLASENKLLSQSNQKYAKEMLSLKTELEAKQVNSDPVRTLRSPPPQAPAFDIEGLISVLQSEFQSRSLIALEATNASWQRWHDCTMEAHRMEVAAIKAANRRHITSINFKRTATLIHNARLKQSLDSYRNREEEGGSYPSDLENQLLRSELDKAHADAETTRTNFEELTRNYENLSKNLQEQQTSFQADKANSAEVLDDALTTISDLERQNQALAAKLKATQDTHEKDMSECVSAVENEVASQHELIREEKRRNDEALRRKEEDIERLEEDLRRSTEELRAKAAELSAAAKNAKELKERNEQSSRLLEQAAQQDKDMIAANQKLRKDYNALSDSSIAQQEEIQHLVERTERLEHEAKTLRAERHALQMANDELRELLRSHEGRAAELTRTSSTEIGGLKKTVADQSVSIEGLQKELAEAKHTERRLLKEKANLESVKSDLETGQQSQIGKEQTLLTACQKLTKDKEALVETVKKAEEDAQQLHEAARKQTKDISSLKESNAELQARVRELSEEMTVVGAKHRQHLEELSTLRRMSDDLRNELEAKKEELELAKSAEAKAKAGRRELSSEREALIEELDAAKRERDAAAASLRKAQSQAKEGADALKDKSAAEDHSRELESAIAAVKAEKSKQDLEIRNLKEDIALLEELLGSEKSRVSELNKKLQQQESKVLHYGSEIEDLQGQVDAQNRNVAAKDRAIAALKDQQAATESELEATHGDRVNLEKSSDSYMKLLAEREAACRQQATVISSLENEISALQHQLQEATEAQQVQEEEDEERIKRAETLCARLSEESDAKRQTISDLQTAIDELTVERANRQGRAGLFGKSSVTLFEELEEFTRSELASMWADALVPLATDFLISGRRSAVVSQQSKQMRQRLEAQARDRQSQEADHATDLQKAHEEISILAEENSSVSEALAVLQDELPRGATWIEYVEGRAKIYEEYYDSSRRIMSYIPKANLAEESRARATLALLGSFKGDRNGGTAGELKLLSKSLRAARRELSLVKHLYRYEKEIEAGSLRRSIARLGHRAAQVGEAQSAYSIAAALSTLEDSEETARVIISSAFASCLASIEVSMLPLIDPLNFL